MKDKGCQIAAVSLTFLVLCTSSTLLRLFVRVKFTRLGWDDLLAVLSLFNLIGACVCLLYGIQYGGIGQHTVDIPKNKLRFGIKLFLIARLEYIAARCLINITFCITLLYIMNKRVNAFLTHTVCVVVIFDILEGAFFFSYILLSCRPTTYLLSPIDPSKTGTCAPTHRSVLLQYAQAAISLLSDAYLALLPTVFIWRLRLDWKVRIATSALLGLGGVTCIMTLARVPYFRRLDDPDVLYVNAQLIMLSLSELGVSILATSIGTLRPLLVWAEIFPMGSEVVPSLNDIQLSATASIGAESKPTEGQNLAERAV